MAQPGREHPVTPDGRYLVVKGVLWRRSDPALTPAQRDARVRELMAARRDVHLARRRGDPAAERRARARVHAAKVALGERGPPWWTDGAPDWTRHAVGNTPYASWYARVTRGPERAPTTRRSRAP